MAGLAMKMVSLLCLMMILPGGLANPVADEGGSGLDFVAGLVDSAFLWFIPDSVSNDTDVLHDQDDDNATKVSSYVRSSRMETVGSLGYGRAFVSDSVENLGFVNGVKDESLCCEECHKEHPSAEFYDFIYQSFKNVATTSCTCKKSKPLVHPRTSQVGISSGQCGTWVYHGDGPLGDGVYFESGLGEVGDMTNVNDSSMCCEQCSRRFPATSMFTFINKSNKCKCYMLQRGQTPVTRLANFSTGACGEVSEPVVTVEEKSESDASEDSVNMPEAAALTITTTTEKPEICSGSFVCCPHLTDGDNTAGTEKFIQESEYKDSFSSCEDACKNLYPFSNGVTQSKTKTYKNGKPRCWCEFGQAVFHQTSGYQTCLFPVGEDDYDY